MTRLPFVRLALALAVCASLPAFAEDAPGGDNGPLAVVNGREIPRLRGELLLRQLPPSANPGAPQARAMMREELISRELVAQDAERKGLLKNAEVLEQIEIGRQQALLNAYLQDFVKSNPIGESDVKAEYERLRKETTGSEYKAAHILVKTEGEARDLIAKIRKGAKFADLARIASDDPGSKDTGGDLGWSSPGNYVKPFGDALAKLKKGEMTQEPVQTQYGYHVIRLDDQRPMKAPPLEQLRPQIEQRLQQARVQKLLADLRSRARIQ
jgi:peptidyl-prolyl cis-trans isomerase C